MMVYWKGDYTTWEYKRALCPSGVYAVPETPGHSDYACLATWKILSEREKAGWPYLFGYVFSYFKGFFLPSMLEVFLSVWKSAPLPQFPKRTSWVLRLRGFLCGPLFLLGQGIATEEGRNAFRVSLTPQRLCTTHSLPSLSLKWIRAELNIKTHSDTPSFSRPSVQPLLPGEEYGFAELWEYKIELPSVPCQSTTAPTHRQNVQPCACHMQNATRLPRREGTTPPGQFLQPRRLIRGFKWGRGKRRGELTAGIKVLLSWPTNCTWWGR